MACTGVKCAINASCVPTNGGYTCRCIGDYKGDGFVKCTPRSTIISHDDLILIIIFIALLFVGLVVILIYCLCRRRMRNDTSKEPLVHTVEDPYDLKWKMMLPDANRDSPPPYVEKTEPTTFVNEAFEVTEDDDRVPIEADEEEFEDEVDVIKEIDNPVYDTVSTPEDTSDTSEPTDEEKPQDTSDDVEPPIPEKEEETLEKEPDTTEDTEEQVEPEPSLETDPADENVVEPEVNDNVEETTEADPIDPIKITFEENEDAPNTITATVTTPNASLTINLNINVPGASAEVGEEPAVEALARD